MIGIQTAITVIFALELALLLTHEMDAVRRKEWKMFTVLKNMADEKAYQIFLLLHIPLYLVLLLFLSSPFLYMGYYMIDIFLMAHMLVHFKFRKHPANKLNRAISKGIINSAGLLAAVHFIAISLS